MVTRQERIQQNKNLRYLTVIIGTLSIFPIVGGLSILASTSEQEQREKTELYYKVLNVKDPELYPKILDSQDTTKQYEQSWN